MIPGTPLPAALFETSASSASPVSSVSPVAPERSGQSAPSTPPSGLDGDFVRLRELCPVLELRLLGDADPDPSAADGWYSGAQLASDERALADALAGEEARIAAGNGGRAPRPHVTASRLLHHYVWSACLLIAGPWHLARRVPALGPADLWLHAPTGRLALRPLGYVALPGDDELRAELRAAVVTHVEPVLAAFAGPTRRRDRALWGMVTDDLASAVWYLGRMLDAQEADGEEGAGKETDEAHTGCAATAATTEDAATAEDVAVASASALLPGGTLPLPGAADFRRLRTPDGREHHTRTRLGCCLYYATGPTAVACLTCPRTGDEERLQRF